VNELDAFDYALPNSAIAQRPLEGRSASRLLVDGDPIEHRHTADLVSLVGPGDVVVVNRSKVVPARLKARRPTGGVCEVLLLEELDGVSSEWLALVKPSRKIAPGTLLSVSDDFSVIVDDDHGDGIRSVRLEAPDPLAAVFVHGAMPHPPYITETDQDPDRYQTVFARTLGSAAAPTAGLHLTHEVLDAIRERGAEIVEVELHVGLDTFRPVTVEKLDDHKMHSERYSIEPGAWERIRAASRVVAVGTTVVRALESVGATGELEGRTSLFIRRGFDFRVVNALMTNFHMPRSTLLVMIDAFMGDRWRELYRVALDNDYRFLSFGDAMFIERPR
jgi:S-adenosylmethionine:tRNA ribosyltransferase-isomerase